MKRFLILYLLLAGGVAAVHAQSAVDGFDPNANGTIQVVVVQPDGKILVGGDFTTLAPNGGATVTRNYMARLNSDGTLDSAFNPNSTGVVFSIVVQADDKILAGGAFTSIGGQTRNYIARLDATTGAADSFNPNASSTVRSIAVQADGKVLAGGGFTSIGGQTRNRIARLDATTGAADSFNPNANSLVYSVRVQADGKILAGGVFTSIGGQTRNYIARLNAATGLADSFNPNANNWVYAMALQRDSKISVSGYFTNIGGQTRNRIARLNPDGTADSFDPNADGVVFALAVQPDGRVLAGGQFTTISGETRNRIARLDPVTASADCFDPNANGNVHSIAVQADGKILAGGEFTGIVGAVRNHIARLEEYTPSSCTAGAPGCGWQQDDMHTFTQANWGDFNTAAGALLSANFSTLYGANALIVGGTNTMRFTSASSVVTYLPASGTPGVLTGSLTNPTSSPAGEFGGQVVALQLNVDFSDANLIPGTTRLSSLYICDFSAVPVLNGQTVQQFLTTANWILGGGSAPIGASTASAVANLINNAFVDGTPSAFAQENLFVGFCPCTLQITAAVSRKTHGGAGTFDILLPLAGQPGVECRNSGGAHTLVFSFSKNVVSGNASVTSGIGSVSGSPTFSGNTMTVNLTGVTNPQTITITLSGVTDVFSQVLPDTQVNMGVLIGDTTGDRSVNSADISQTKSRSGKAVDGSNFRSDVTHDGSLNSADISLVKSKSGTALPP